MHSPLDSVTHILGICTHPYTGAHVSSTYARTHVPVPRRFLSKPNQLLLMSISSCCYFSMFNSCTRQTWRPNWCVVQCRAWCSEIGSPTSLQLQFLHTSSDVRELISLHQAVHMYYYLAYILWMRFVIWVFGWGVRLEPNDLTDYIWKRITNFWWSLSVEWQHFFFWIKCCDSAAQRLVLTETIWNLISLDLIWFNYLSRFVENQRYACQATPLLKITEHDEKKDIREKNRIGQERERFWKSNKSTTTCSTGRPLKACRPPSPALIIRNYI